MIHVLSIVLFNTVCYSSNISYTFLNNTNISAILEKFAGGDADSGEVMPMPKESIYEHLINNRLTTVEVKISSPAEGPFYNLIVNICSTILNNFKTRKIPKYFKVLGNSLRGLGHDFFKTLVRNASKKLKHLSEYNGSFLRRKVRYFLKVIQEEKPRRIEFFKAMNALFSIWWDTKMDEYIWFLKGFGRGRRRSIHYQTRRLCSAVVLDRLNRLRTKAQEQILQKLMLAYREYLAERVNYEITE